MASCEENQQDDVVAIELPAPAGWIKKFTPKKGGTSRKNDIVFISPTGEEIKHKRLLEQYLKSHPDGPVISEFDWGLGDSPRRSARLSEKSKATEVLDSETPKKKQKKSSLKKGARVNNNRADEDDKDANAEETKESAEDAGDEEMITAEVLPQVPEIMEEKTKGYEVVEEPQASENPTNTATVNADAKIEESMNSTNIVTGTKIEEPNEVTAELAGTNADESKGDEVPSSTTTGGGDAQIEESMDATNAVTATKIEGPKDNAAELAGTNADESKDAEVPSSTATGGGDAQIEESMEATNAVTATKIEEPKDVTAELAGTNVAESKRAEIPINTGTQSGNAMIEESTDASDAVTAMEIEEPKDATAELAGTNSDESKG